LSRMSGVIGEKKNREQLYLKVWSRDNDHDWGKSFRRVDREKTDGGGRTGAAEEGELRGLKQ